MLIPKCQKNLQLTILTYARKHLYEYIVHNWEYKPYRVSFKLLLPLLHINLLKYVLKPVSVLELNSLYNFLLDRRRKERTRVKAKIYFWSIGASLVPKVLFPTHPLSFVNISMWTRQFSHIGWQRKVKFFSSFIKTENWYDRNVELDPDEGSTFVHT